MFCSRWLRNTRIELFRRNPRRLPYRPVPKKTVLFLAPIPMSHPHVDVTHSSHSLPLRSNFPFRCNIARCYNFPQWFCEDFTRFLADYGVLSVEFVWEELVVAWRGREEGHPLRAGMARRTSAAAGGSGQAGGGRRVGGVGEASKIGEERSATYTAIKDEQV